MKVGFAQFMTILGIMKISPATYIVAPVTTHQHVSLHYFLAMSTSTLGWIFFLCTDCVHFGCMKRQKMANWAKGVQRPPRWFPHVFSSMWWWLDVNGNLLQRWPDMCFRWWTIIMSFSRMLNETPPIIIIHFLKLRVKSAENRPTLPLFATESSSPLVFSCNSTSRFRSFNFHSPTTPGSLGWIRIEGEKNPWKK